LGALPLSFEERLRGRRPLDGLDLTVTYDDALDDDPTELFAARRRSRGDRVR
jgi:hypothetical protein